MSDAQATSNGIHLTLGPHEGSLFRELLSEMRTLLEADLPRADPVTARLFPATFEDEAEEQRHRELIGDGLRQAKLESLKEVEEAVGTAGEVDTLISGEEVDHWLALLTDLRLAIGTRLEITEESYGAEPDPEDPNAPALAVLHWLGWLQETLLDAMGHGGQHDDAAGG